MSSVVFFPGFDSLDRGLQSDVSAAFLALCLVAVVVTGAIQGMVGFGYALTTPRFVSVVDPTLAVVVLAVPPWRLNMFQVGETGTGLAFVRVEWTLLLLAVVGVGVLAEFSTTRR